LQIAGDNRTIPYQILLGWCTHWAVILAGSQAVAENIARMSINPDADAVLRAARAHEMILRFPSGYDTKIGEGGAMLSPGSGNAWRWRAPCTVIRSLSSSTSRTRTSTMRATRHCTRPSSI
jgi:hypothetical protein